MFHKQRTKFQIVADIESQSKVCNRCSTRQPFKNFYSDKQRVDKQCCRCKSCDKIKVHQYYQDHIEQQRIRGQQYYQQNKKNVRQRHLQYYTKNKKQIIEQAGRHYKDRKKHDPIFKLKCNMSTSLRHALTRIECSTNGCSTLSMLDITKEQFSDHFLQYIDQLCERCKSVIISINNSEIDHIIPICMSKTRKDVIRLNQLSNLRLICKSCNREKRDKIE